MSVIHDALAFIDIDTSHFHRQSPVEPSCLRFLPQDCLPLPYDQLPSAAMTRTSLLGPSK